MVNGTRCYGLEQAAEDAQDASLVSGHGLHRLLKKSNDVSLVSGHNFSRADGSRFRAGFTPCMPCAAAKAVLFCAATAPIFPQPVKPCPDTKLTTSSFQQPVGNPTVGT